MLNLIFHNSRLLSNSEIAIRRSFTCGMGLDGGHVARKLLSLLHNSVLYTDDVMLDRSIELITADDFASC